MLKRIFKQKRYFKNIYKSQKGITGLETAIILIAFVVVAAVFAYTVLSAGLFSTQKSQEAVYNGLSETQSTMVVKGAVLSTSDSPYTQSKSIRVTLALSTGGNGIDFTAGSVSANGIFTAPKTNKIVVNYNDAAVHVADVAWTATWIGNNNTDRILDPGEKITLEIDLSNTSIVVDANHQFTLEIKSPKGAMLTIQRTMPARLYAIDNLN